MVTKFAGVQKCLTHWMKTKTKENMTLDDLLLTLANIYILTKMIQMKERVRIMMTA